MRVGVHAPGVLILARWLVKVGVEWVYVVTSGSVSEKGWCGSGYACSVWVNSGSVVNNGSCGVGIHG